MKIMVINGPGLCMHENCGFADIDSLNKGIAAQSEKLGITCEFYQGNSEGELVTIIQNAWNNAGGIILNAGDYASYSIAIRDAISSVKDVPVIEVNLTNTHAQEETHKASVLSPVCKGVITGFGGHSYFLALQALAAE